MIAQDDWLDVDKKNYMMDERSQKDKRQSGQSFRTIYLGYLPACSTSCQSSFSLIWFRAKHCKYNYGSLYSDNYGTILRHCVQSIGNWFRKLFCKKWIYFKLNGNKICYKCVIRQSKTYYYLCVTCYYGSWWGNVTFVFRNAEHAEQVIRRCSTTKS